MCTNSYQLAPLLQCILRETEERIFPKIYGTCTQQDKNKFPERILDQWPEERQQFGVQ